MLRTIVSQCRRRRRNIISMYVTGVVIVVVVLYYQIQHTDISSNISSRVDPAVVLSRRGMLSPSTISSTEYAVFSATEAVRMRGINRTGVFASLKPGIQGLINMHTWFDLCGENILTLKMFPLFPNVPSARKLWPALEISNHGEKYGKRVFGYLVPPVSASYSFRLRASGSAEFWLSTDDKPQNSKCLVCKKEGITTNTEPEINLHNSESYYFEVLHQHGGLQKNDYFKLEWKIAQETDYRAIERTHVTSYHDDLDILGDAVNLESFPPVGLQMHRPNSHQKIGSDSLIDSREYIYKLPFIAEKTIKDLFPKCQYKPDYLITYKLKRYASTLEIIYSAVYPSDNTNVTDTNGLVRFGNDVMEESNALEIVEMVLAQFRKKGLRKFSLESIINIESKRGRYLVELQLLHDDTKESVRFSEYVYIPKGSSSLCYPEDFAWNKTSTVNFIVTSGRNQGRWVYHFIQSMAKIYEETKDNNFNVIINDFLCPDADIKQALESSSLPNYLYLTNTGDFQKTLGIQQAAAAITDPNGIVVVLDLHLDVPSNFLDDIRKHTVQGRLVYSPVIMRMRCGSNAVVEMGSFWEFNGFGIVGMYKQDWDKFGGMNVEEFKHKWGGEDNEMMDRILMARFEVDRKKIKGLVHYYHTKYGMWNKSK